MRQHAFQACLFSVGICLPSVPWVSDDDCRRIVATIRDSIEG